MTEINDVASLIIQISLMHAKQSAAASPTSIVFTGATAPVASLGANKATHLRLQALTRYVGARSGDSRVTDNSASQVVLVVDGAVKLIASASAGRTQVMGFYFKDDFIYVPARETHAYNLCALKDCELVAFPATEFIRLAQSDKTLNNNFLSHLLRALSRCREKSLALGQKTARERVATFLVSMAERIGAPFSNGALLDLPMSRRDIGDNIGLTIETVSRQMTELRNAGLVSTSGRSQVKILDLAALKQEAGHLSGLS
ncbi:Crp/Fnr family transcriptional regulator [Pontixanthobacter aquaemixtae]|uniref:Helix-turn-helix domain-containing protein n=1 Tax=Pontixanthobacter aquaemixtae TaxID=1958940 RepID=A0A844ZV23_9SPHN|nr:helix-turn-helix domain-containing protein [Pontixanthobacter aquaemixtae]MXO91000.1 helix-turn-helix domain-containing protein [Pontixanthobacter aquaemixtae]